MSATFLQGREGEGLAMYIFVNTDLGMNKGRAAAQVGHIVQKITEEVVRSGYEDMLSIPSEKDKYYMNEYQYYQRWNNGVICVLRATAQEMVALRNLPRARYFIDNGELTVIGFPPGITVVRPDMSDLIKKFKLY
jgi:peptidyl-tRNA hydrolase